MNYRSLRVSKLIQEELGKIIEKELEFPGALVTITEVKIDKNFAIAKVRVSILPSSEAEKTLKNLAANRGRLQYLLLKKMNIKPMPQIEFEIDHGPENAARVEKLLGEDNNK